jgi:hypothetical protein
VKGRPAIVKSLRALLIRTHRFGRHRARTADDIRWAARLIDALTTALSCASPGDDAAHPEGRSGAR